MTFVPDLRPMMFSAMFVGGNNVANPMGLNATWRATPANIIALMRSEAAACGAINRYMLSMPQGSLGPPNIFPASNSGILEATPLNYLTNTFAPLAGEEWGIYTGFALPTNGQQNSAETQPANAHALGTSGATFLQTALALYGNRGFRTIGLDEGQSDPDFVDTVLPAYVPWCTRIISEAFPLVNIGAGPAPGGVRYIINPAHAIRRAYLALDWAFVSVFDPDEAWTLPYGAEFHVICDNPTYGHLQSLVRRGFIVSPAAGCSQTVKDFVRTTYFGRRRPGGSEA